jgi:hypothetical protein
MGWSFNVIMFTWAAMVTTFMGLSFFIEYNTKTYLTKLVLGFTTGLSIIALSGLVANYLSLSVFYTQAIIILIFLFNSFRNIPYYRPILKREEKFLIFLSAAITLGLLTYFSKIIIWSEGDGVFHGALIKDLLSGLKLPTPLNVNSDWFHYPKALHFYLAFYSWTFGFGVLNSIKIIPLLFLFYGSIGIYALSVEAGFDERIGFFSSVVSWMTYQKYFPLVFTLLPSLSSELILLSIGILALNKNSGWKTMLYLLVFQYLLHARYLALAIPFLVWKLMIKQNVKPGIRGFVGFGASLFIIGIVALVTSRLSQPNPQSYFSTLSESLNLVGSQLITIWLFYILAFMGILITIIKRDIKNEFLFLWLSSWFIIIFLMAIRVLNASLTVNRAHQILYLPLSLFGGITLNGWNKRIKLSILTIFVIPIFIFIMFNTFFNLHNFGWEMPDSDYAGIKSLEGKNGICLNIDPTGEWIYPISGMRITNPRGLPPILNETQRGEIVFSPESNGSIKILQSVEEKYGEVYIFISQKSSETPGYSLFENFFPVVDMKKFRDSDIYELFYEENGSVVFRYKG